MARCPFVSILRFAAKTILHRIVRPIALLEKTACVLRTAWSLGRQSLSVLRDHGNAPQPQSTLDVLCTLKGAFDYVNDQAEVGAVDQSLAREIAHYLRQTAWYATVATVPPGSALARNEANHKVHTQEVL